MWGFIIITAKNMSTILNISVLVIIAIVSAVSIIVSNYMEAKNSAPKKKEVVRRPSRPKFSAVLSTPENERERKVDQLLKKKILSLAEQQYIYDFLMATGKEKWRYIKGYEGYYRISTYGLVESCRYGKYLTPTLVGRKYQVTLTVNTKAKGCYVHKLVAETFIPNLARAKTVKAKDNNYRNCDVRNLIWKTDVTKGKLAVAA